MRISKELSLFFFSILAVLTAIISFVSFLLIAAFSSLTAFGSNLLLAFSSLTVFGSYLTEKQESIVNEDNNRNLDEFTCFNNESTNMKYCFNGQETNGYKFDNKYDL